MQIHHLSSPCGLVRIQPITSWGIPRGLSRIAGQGRGTKVKHPVLHALARSGADDVTLRENIPSSKTMGYNPGFLLKRGSISDAYEFTQNPHKQSYKQFQNPPCSKPWAVPGFLLKIGQFRNLGNLPEIHKNNPASS